MSTPTPADYQARFQEELTRLNPAQREAVEHIEGPVLVIAGPGTGKTHILASRIGHILLETDTSAQSILCLTFTDAGVRAMRQRLLQLIGPEAHRVHIYTFHSFCNTVIQDNLAQFGRQGLEPITELEQIDITRQLLENLPGEHPLRRGKIQPTFYERHLRDLFQLMKTEGWTPSYLRAAIATYLAELPERAEYRYQVNRGHVKKGDLKQSKIDEQALRMEILESAVTLFPAYEKALAKARRYDYADMILWVLDAFRTNERLLRSYQEQYLYFLVDEYQDTNGAQNELLHLLAAFWDMPNLFIVGDDDQSIFEFQGARLKNLVDYYEAYREQIKVVLLDHNYRSTQVILDGAKRLIDHNEQRITSKLSTLGIVKDLQAALPERAEVTAQPQIRVYPNTFQESIGVLRGLQAQRAKGVPWREMAVIYAKHQQVAELQRMLDKQGIPYQTRRKTNILDTLLIRQLREMLAYLADEQQQPFSGEHRLFKMLHYPCFGLRPLDLGLLAVALRQKPYQERPSWRAFLQQPQQWPTQISASQWLQTVGKWWETTLQQLPDLGLPSLVERLLNGSGLLGKVLTAPDRLWQVQVAKTFLDFVREEVARQPRLSLAQFLRILEQMDSNRLSLSLRKDIELEDGVQLVTAHSSKGLEFRTVFLLDCTQRAWEGSRRNSSSRFSLPDTLTLSGQDFADETRRRLFYVAATRAKEQLFVTYARQNHKGKDQQVCRFVDEIQQGEAWQQTEVQLSPEVLLPFEIDFLQTDERPQLPAMERSAIAKLLEGFQLSVSTWHRYLDCPLRFFYEVVLQVPQIQRAAASYGNAMHNALQRYFNAMLAEEERRFPPAADLVQLFVDEMQYARSYFEAAEYERRLAQGKRNLQRYHEQFASTWVQNCRTELNIQQVEVDGIPIKGVIDRIDLLNERQVRIVDYKTGSHNDKKLKPANAKQPEGGNYWRQLIFYKLLWENKTGETRQVQSAQISYLDLDKKGELTMAAMEFSPQEVRQVRDLLNKSYQAIQNHEFYEGCGEEDCEWCNFVRENVAPPAHTSVAIEELDE
ncbi:MAG: ATP-dependent DNA helicase [Bacteroidota bacterium]